jgi:cyanate permease
LAAASHPYRWAMLAGVLLLYYSFGLTVVSLAPLVGAITAELGLSHSAMGSVLGAWPLVFIATAIPCGVIMDRIGPRRALFAGALIVALSGLLRGLSEGYFSLFAAVGLFGLGGPLVSVGAPKVISLWFTGRQRGLAMGVYFSGNALGGITALSLTNSVLMPYAGGDWRAVLMFHAAIAFCAALVWLGISAHPASRAVERALAAEQRDSYLREFAELIRLPVVRIILVMAVFMLAFNHGLNNWLPEILRSGGMDAATAGYWASVPTAVGIFTALVIPRLAVPQRRFAILFAIYVGAGAAALLIQTGAGLPLAAGLLLQGTARGTMTVIAVLILMETKEIGARSVGSATGMYFSAGEVGGVLGPLGIGYVYDVTGGFSAGLTMLAAIMVLLMLLLIRLRRLSR